MGCHVVSDLLACSQGANKRQLQCSFIVLQQLIVCVRTGVQEFLTESVVECAERDDREACNRVANLCTLQMYAPATASCLAFLEMMEAIEDFEYHSIPGWSNGLPWYVSEYFCMTWKFCEQIQMYTVRAKTMGGGSGF